MTKIVTETVVSKSSLFRAKKEDYTPEQWEGLQRKKHSEEQAHKQLAAIYGARVANVVIFNVTICYYNIYRKFADTYEHACECLGDEMVMNIIHRAVNDLPALGTERNRNQSLANYWGELANQLLKVGEKNSNDR